MKMLVFSFGLLFTSIQAMHKIDSPSKLLPKKICLEIALDQNLYQIISNETTYNNQLIHEGKWLTLYQKLFPQQNRPNIPVWVSKCKSTLILKPQHGEDPMQ